MAFDWYERNVLGPHGKVKKGIPREHEVGRNKSNLRTRRGNRFTECQDLWPICREPHGVTPAKAGVQPPRAGHEPYITSLARLDSGVRRNDEIFAGIEH
jgi:hypothetical protein